MTDTTTTEDAWFYTQAGQRRGPVPADTVRELLATKAIDGETPIWRKGFEDWKILRDTEFRSGLSETPPPVAATELNNGAVWMLAFAPIAYFFVDDFVLAYQLKGGEDAILSALTWLIPLAVNCGLCLLDDRQLREAGYKSTLLTFFAVILAPVYLFMRARTLRQKPLYGFVWIGSFIASIVLRMIFHSPQ